jgi:hypothetical protein
MSRIHSLIFQGLLCIVVAAIAVPAVAATIKTNLRPGMSVKSYKTYSWGSQRAFTKTGFVDNPPITATVVEVVDQEMNKRGFQRLDKDGDLLITFLALTGAQAQLEAVIYVGDVDWGFFGEPVQTLSRYNKDGTLAVNMIDRKANKSFWAFMVTDTLDKASEAPGKVRSLVPKAFKKFPKQ